MVVPATVNFLKSKWRLFASAHPLAKGVIAYSIVWPTSSFMQQTLEGKPLSKYADIYTYIYLLIKFGPD